VVDLFAEFVPLPIEEQRPGMERLFQEMLDMSHEEVGALDQIPVQAWLEQREAEPLLTMIIAGLASNMFETTPEIALEKLSMFGVIGMIRGFVCCEAFATAPMPDPWEGLMIPLGRGLEAKGCDLRRAARVADVLVENGRATGVVLRSGEEVRGRAVAIATGLKRIPKLFSQLPAEVTPVLESADQAKGFDCCTYCLLDQDIVPLRNTTMVTDETGFAHGYLFPMHAVAPGSTEPGRWLIATQTQYTAEAYEAVGGHEGAVAKLLALQEELYPGFEQATVERADQVHPYGFLNGCIAGPKLPAQSAEIQGL
jgi:hypothetical protein